MGRWQLLSLNSCTAYHAAGYPLEQTLQGMATSDHLNAKRPSPASLPQRLSDGCRVSPNDVLSHHGACRDGIRRRRNYIAMLAIRRESLCAQQWRRQSSACKLRVGDGTKENQVEHRSPGDGRNLCGQRLHSKETTREKDKYSLIRQFFIFRLSKRQRKTGRRGSLRRNRPGRLRVRGNTKFLATGPIHFVWRRAKENR